ncbi:hypothetical protein [Nocardia sp. NBC_01009]|uniref:hypothetical protein n=1 Tax=Nocardia sp. NBC_01009 TaxID=2975996 RepID=UPI00386E92C0|nr:hypothetical protein OHA42_01690 [Nocardia sp. NBC_01009]
MTRLILGADDSVRLVAEAVLDRREIGIHTTQFMIDRLIADRSECAAARPAAAG